jgi:hypothetical protein
MKYQSLRQIHKITQWKDGCVFKTKPVGYAWITFDHNPTVDTHIQFNSISTDLLVKLSYKTTRRVSDDTPDMDITTLEQLGVK